MKAAGGIFIALGIIVLAACALWPRTIDIGFGAEGNCGPSALRLLANETGTSDFERAAISQCETQAFWTLAAGVAIFLVGLVTGLIMLQAAAREEHLHRVIAAQADNTYTAAAAPQPFATRASRLPAPPPRVRARRPSNGATRPDRPNQ